MNYILQAKLIYKSYIQNEFHFTDIALTRNFVFFFSLSSGNMSQSPVKLGTGLFLVFKVAGA
jgi:hypothetical protein